MSCRGYVDSCRRKTRCHVTAQRSLAHFLVLCTDLSLRKRHQEWEMKNRSGRRDGLYSGNSHAQTYPNMLAWLFCIHSYHYIPHFANMHTYLLYEQPLSAPLQKKITFLLWYWNWKLNEKGSGKESCSDILPVTCDDDREVQQDC